jgi:hypothetical protein
MMSASDLVAALYAGASGYEGVIDDAMREAGLTVECPACEGWTIALWAGDTSCDNCGHHYTGDVPRQDGRGNNL